MLYNLFSVRYNVFLTFVSYPYFDLTRGNCALFTEKVDYFCAKFLTWGSKFVKLFYNRSWRLEDTFAWNKEINSDLFRLSLGYH